MSALLYPAQDDIRLCVYVCLCGAYVCGCPISIVFGEIYQPPVLVCFTWVYVLLLADRPSKSCGWIWFE
eukprot:m.65641 g.65641  ORF g.65641 m.65641 type:complete len:69 (-) comp12066_c0_seq2:654-860(-)